MNLGGGEVAEIQGLSVAGGNGDMAGSWQKGLQSSIGINRL